MIAVVCLHSEEALTEIHHLFGSPWQVEVFVMSKSGFAFSAAYSTVPVRGVWMQRDVDACTWSNYNDHCLMRACPGQVGCPWKLLHHLAIPVSHARVWQVLCASTYRHAICLMLAPLASVLQHLLKPS